MDDKTGISWSDPGWPYGDLNRSTALLYFELSPFFDPSSNNAEARSRGLDPANEHVLRSMPIDRPEYVVAEAQEPHLFVIRRQARQRDGTLQHQAYYHILYMTIYQAPTLHSVISGRLRRCMFLMRQGLERVRQDLAPLPKLLLEQERKAALQAEAVAAGEQGPAAPAAAAAAAAAAAGAVGEPQPVAMPEVLSREEKGYWERSDNIIMRTLQRYPMPQLPGIPAHQQPQQQQQEGAFVATAPKAETAQQPAAAAAAVAAGATDAPTTAAAAAAPAGAAAAEAAAEGPPAITAAAAEPVGQAKRKAGSGAQGVPAPARSRSKTPPPAPVAAAALRTAGAATPTPPAAAPTAAATAAGAAAASAAAGAGGGRAAAPTTSQTESGAAGGETSSAHQGTTASGGTAAASRAGPMKVRLKMKGLGSKPPSPALGAQGSQGQPPPAEQQPAAKRARR